MRTRYSKYVSLVLNLTMVKSLKKALDIMEFVSESNNSPSIVQIANHLKLNRTTTYRLVHTLHSQGYLKKDGDKNGYQIGLRLLPLAARLLDSDILRKEALPHLQELAQKTGIREMKPQAAMRSGRPPQARAGGAETSPAPGWPLSPVFPVLQTGGSLRG